MNQNKKMAEKKKSINYLIPFQPILSPETPPSNAYSVS